MSDPGQALVSLCHAQGIQVLPVPGPCAITAALSALGMGEEGFSFIGFLPAKASERQSVLCHYTQQDLCTVFYEAPHRIRSSLDDLLPAGWA